MIISQNILLFIEKNRNKRLIRITGLWIWPSALWTHMLPFNSPAVLERLLHSKSDYCWIMFSTSPNVSYCRLSASWPAVDRNRWRKGQPTLHLLWQLDERISNHCNCMVLLFVTIYCDTSSGVTAPVMRLAACLNLNRFACSSFQPDFCASCQGQMVIWGPAPSAGAAHWRKEKRASHWMAG